MSPVYHGETLNEFLTCVCVCAHTHTHTPKVGESYQWKDRTTRLIYSYYDRDVLQWKKDTWSKTIRNTVRSGSEGGGRILDGRSTTSRGEQMTDRALQTSIRAMGRRADRTSRLVREVGDSIIGTMDSEGGMEQNGDNIDQGTTSHNPSNYYVDIRLPDAGRSGPEDNGLLALGYLSCVRDTETEMGLGLLGGKPSRDTTGHLQKWKRPSDSADGWVINKKTKRHPSWRV